MIKRGDPGQRFSAFCATSRSTFNAGGCRGFANSTEPFGNTRCLLVALVWGWDSDSRSVENPLYTSALVFEWLGVVVDHPVVGQAIVLFNRRTTLPFIVWNVDRRRLSLRHDESVVNYYG